MAEAVSASNTHGPLTTIRLQERTMAASKSIRQITCRNYYVAGKSSKVCPACSEVLPLTDFPIARKTPSGRASHCKECRRKKYPYNAVAKRAIHIRHRYGLEIEDYVSIWEKQGGKCAICRMEISLGKAANLDHCHATGKVRGMLCFFCNSALGKFKDNVEILQSAIEYLNASR